MNAQTIAEAKCREIYLEAEPFFARLPREEYYGFKVLYGPPLYQPPILFVGYQPGGGADDFERETARGSDKRWPTECEYATESWKLAKQMRQMFTRPRLLQCVGINAIFLRSPTVAHYKRTIDRGMRAEIEAFCLVRVARIIEVIDPQKIVAIGFDTLRLFGDSTPGLTNDNKRCLTTIGKIGGRSPIGTLHLSGARIAAPDLDRIRDQVLAKS